MKDGNELPASVIRLFRVRLSGHCHRVELFLSLLGLPYELIEVDLAKEEHKRPDFLAMNAFAQVPVVVDREVTLADSNAILVYLACRYGEERWYPRLPQLMAEIQRWLSVAAGRLAFGAAAARGVQLFGRPDDPRPCIERAKDLLSIMDGQLKLRPFLIGEEVSIADIAMYSYTAVAPEGFVSLVGFPHVQEWLRRIEALPGFLRMPSSPIGLNARSAR